MNHLRTASATPLQPPLPPRRPREPAELTWVGLHLVLLVLLLSGLILIAQALDELHWSVASLHWPSTPGLILQSEVRPVSGPESPTYPTDAPSYVARLAYSYSVHHQLFVGHRRHFAEPPLGSKAAAQQLATRYRVGQRVTVRYDPANPARCVLETGPSPGEAVLFAAGLVLALTGLIGWYRLIRRGEAFRLHRWSRPADSAVRRASDTNEPQGQ